MTMADVLKRKADLIAVGLYPTSKGIVLRISDMNDAHLVNAFLKSLAQDEPETITTPLAAEVKRRNLEDYAREVASRR